MLVAAGAIAVLDLAATRLYLGRIRALVEENPATTSYMERATRSGRGPRTWQWTPLDSIPRVAACAVVFSEDRNFFRIGTLDWVSQKAMFRRVIGGDLSRGSSGIAQQLARNLYLGPQRTPRRKAREYLLAWQLSHTLTKARQLEIYLNVVEWGNGIWGIGDASRHYFGVEPAELRLSQSVMLASLLPAPRRGLERTTSEFVADRMDVTAWMLTRALLVDDLTYRATTERLAGLRTGMRAGLTPAHAMARVDSIMGPEPRAFALNGADTVSLRDACHYMRR
ncbi:MAG TPA: biosynthetic peptidoglycan transglycosylase [Vicinamibacterales bacterium]|nr:biosynthetic peptidoglycan transglycosylase [Vicinamibacterales bacterium]